MVGFFLFSGFFIVVVWWLVVFFFKLSCHLLVRSALFWVLRELSKLDIVGGPDCASAEDRDLE